MDRRITDPDVQLLATIAATLRGHYEQPSEDPWAGSPFAWIKPRPSRQRGKIGEQLVAGWCAAKGLDVVAAGDSEADRVINGRRVEVKLSTRWESGVYKFQQIRDQRYDYVICLGICPFDAHCWVIPKSALMTTERKEGLRGQHGGEAARDTAWLSFSADDPPEWLSAHGGRLRDAFTIIRNWRGSEGVRTRR